MVTRDYYFHSYLRFLVVKGSCLLNLQTDYIAGGYSSICKTRQVINHLDKNLSNRVSLAKQEDIGLSDGITQVDIIISDWLGYC